MYLLDLTKQFDSYLYGLIQTDGNFREETRNRGCIAIELAGKDEEILQRIANIVGGNTTCRVRNTNFKNDYKSCTLRIFYNLQERNHLKTLGLLPGKKAELISLPSCNFSEPDYWRGIIDGDGSLGITANGNCFISLVTKSEFLAKSYEELILKITKIKKNTNKNKRDNVFNIMLRDESAQQMVNYLYYNNCFVMMRKNDLAKIVLSWVRPDNILKRKNIKQSWSIEEKKLLQELGPEKFLSVSNRTLQSIKMKLYRGIDK